ncbi:MAG: pseudouridine synthase [bacterium]
MSSRRTAENLIRAGRVTVNGKTITELGTKANPAKDKIAIDGKPVRLGAPAAYILLHKPVGVVTTLLDPEGRPTVRDLLVGVRQRVFPVGRLDYHTAGLLLLTNDGDLALRLTHPRYGVRKTYHVKVKGKPSVAQLAALARGVQLTDGTTSPASAHVMEAREHKSWLALTLSEGKNRQVRRMCEAIGLSVEKLTRVAFGPLKLGKLPPGAWRYLEPEEVDALRRHSGPEVAAAGSPGRRHHGRRRLEKRPADERPRRDATTARIATSRSAVSRTAVSRTAASRIDGPRTAAARVAFPRSARPRTATSLSAAREFVAGRDDTSAAPTGAPTARRRIADAPASGSGGRRASTAPPRRERPRRPR